MTEDAQYMAFIRKIDSDGIIDEPSWGIVERELNALKGRLHATLSLLGDENAQMTLEFVNDKGFFVSAFGKAEVEESILIDEAESCDNILVDISGNIDEVPRCVLVSDDIALDAVKEFFLHGVRSARQQWKRSIDLL